MTDSPPGPDAPLTGTGAAPDQSRCLRMKITLRSTEVFEQTHPLPDGLADPHVWGPAHEDAYGRTFDALVQQGHRHDPNARPEFDIVECPEELRGPRVHRGWSAGRG